MACAFPVRLIQVRSDASQPAGAGATRPAQTSPLERTSVGSIKAGHGRQGCRALRQAGQRDTPHFGALCHYRLLSRRDMQYLCHTNKAPGRQRGVLPCAQHEMAAVPGACPAMLAPWLCPCPPSHSSHVRLPRSLILSATGGLPRGRSVSAAVPWCQPAMPGGQRPKADDLQAGPLKALEPQPS